MNIIDALIEQIENSQSGELSVRRILDESELYTDTDLRKRVREIVIDFQKEFKKHNKKYDNYFEAVMRWAKPVWHIGTNVLAIGSSAVSIAGLLPNMRGQYA